MAAIITDDFRRNSTAFLLKDITDQNTGATDTSNDSGSDFEYFIGIGKSDAWDNDALNNDETNQNFSTPLPNGSIIESKEVIDNLVGAIAIKTDQAYSIIPRIDWVANRRYKRWNENDSTMFDVSAVGGNTYYPCYAIYDSKIYICLDNNSDVGFSAGEYVPGLSTNTPAGTSALRLPNLSADGYIWAYCADLNPSSKFNTDQFISITETATGTATDATTATAGMVYGFEILSAGSGINVGTTGNFKLLLNNNDGTTKEIDLTVDNTGTGSSAAGVVMSSYNTPTQFKTQTNQTIRASVVPAAGTTATALPVIRPLVAPILGFGHTPTADLPAFYAGLAVNYNGNVGGELPTTISYRQISLLRNPTRFNDDSPSPTGDGTYADKEVYNALRKFQFGSTADISGLSSGHIITQDGVAAGTIAAKAFVDYVDETTDCVYFHQSESSLINQQEFTATGNVTINGGSAVTYTAITEPEYTPYTGEVYFLENRKPIQRASAQEEEIKLVIQF
mgnify:FL=1|tara:strand:- start:808 stop:2328 length:1521 start_codon:yes stop_codon:yes gene_type:complete